MVQIYPPVRLVSPPSYRPNTPGNYSNTPGNYSNTPAGTSHNRSHIKQIFVRDTFDKRSPGNYSNSPGSGNYSNSPGSGNYSSCPAKRRPISINRWVEEPSPHSSSLKRPSSSRSGDSVFERLSRPKTSNSVKEGEQVRGVAGEHVRSVVGSTRRNVAVGTENQTRKRSIKSSVSDENLYVEVKQGLDVVKQGGTVVVQHDNWKPARRSTAKSRTKDSRSFSTNSATNSAKYSKSERCKSAPVTPVYSRPTSAYHTKCVDSYCCVLYKGYPAPVLLRTEQEAKEKIKETIRGKKEMLVAILDCYGVVPELFQRNLLSQEEVNKILRYETKQDQNRKVLSILVSRTPYIANNIIEVISGHQPVFKDLLRVGGLRAFIQRWEEEQYGRKVCSALKHLRRGDNTGSRQCPICINKKKKRKLQPATITQVGRDFSNIELTEKKGLMVRPQSSPLTLQERKKLLRNLETISEVSTTFRDNENVDWIRVLKAEPDIIKHIYEET